MDFLSSVQRTAQVVPLSDLQWVWHTQAQSSHTREDALLKLFGFRPYR